MKQDKLTTKYLTVFLLICVALDGILLCGFSGKTWWNNWMVTAPNLFMVLGAFFCILMKKNIDKKPNSIAWYYAYKGIKLLLSIAMVLLYYIIVDQGFKAFLLITTVAYLVALTAETWTYTHYLKQTSKEDKQA